MSADGLLAGDDHIGSLLGGVVRLVEGAVSSAFVPARSTDSPIVFSRLGDGGIGNKLGAYAAEQLASGGPWGAVDVPADEGWRAWVEPVLAKASQADAAADGDAPVASFAVAVRGTGEWQPSEVDAVRLFARLCAGVTRAAKPTSALARQRRIDDLVARIGERLMSTTRPTLQADLDWVVETLCTFLGADAAFVRRNDHANATSVLMAEYPQRGIALEEDPLGIVPFDSDPIFAATRDLKMPFIAHDPGQATDEYTERVKQATGGLVGFSGAGVPLLHGDVTEGCLAFIYLSDLDWSGHEVNALRAVAGLLVQLLHRIDAEERLRQHALTDDLTGLPNRRALLQEVGRRRRSPACPLALLFLDLDRFKVMNDHLGHNAGDRVLQVIADRIRTSLRPTDFAARLGGDEFVVLLEDTGGGLGAVAAADRLLEVISLPIEVGGQRVGHTGSVGITLSENPATSGEDLLGQADIALYAAKSLGRNRTVVFDHELEESVARRASTELLLRQALSDRALRVHYQPEFDLESGRMLAVEALVRWHRRGHGLIPAGEFIPVAEETYIITDIDRWVLEEACMQMASWRDVLPQLDLEMRVNLSPAHLATNGLVQTVADALRHSGIPPELLCLEITEQAVINDVEQAVRLLSDVRAMGVKLAIDDFGTGFSSMAQLKKLPVDILKIDRVFVDGLARDPTDQAIVGTIVGLARALHLDVVGEGVETPADARTLVSLGCRRAQGFLLSHPLSAGDLEPLLLRRQIDMAEVAGAHAGRRRSAG